MKTFSDDPLSDLYLFYIESFTRTLQLLAMLFFIFFGTGMVLDTYNIIIAAYTGEKLIFIMTKQIINIAGVILGMICLINVRDQSRGTSLQFSRMITVFSVIFISFIIMQYYFTFDDIYLNVSRLYKLSKLQVSFYIACIILVEVFVLKYFIGKAKMYHIIVSQAVLDDTKRSLDSLDYPLGWKV